MTKRFLSIACASLMSLSFAVSTAQAATVALDTSGNTCTDKAAFNNKNRPLTTKKIATAITNLQAKLTNQSGAKKKATQDKIKVQKALKKLVKDCLSGKLVPAPEPTDGGKPIPSVFSNLSGSYPTGGYTGSADAIGPIQGTMSALFALDGTLFSGEINFTGTISQLTGLSQLKFSRDIAGTTFPASFTVAGSKIGDVTILIYEDGKITVTNSNSATTVNFNANLNGSQIAGTFTGNYAGIANFSATFNLNK